MRIRAEPLTPLFEPSTHWRHEGARRRLASVFDALLETVSHIQCHYQGLKLSSHAFSNEARRFPYARSLKNADQSQAWFRYRSQSEESTLVFRAHIGTRPVVVKYSADVHRFLSDLLLAPALLHCERIPGDWLFVIMDEALYGALYKLRPSLAIPQQEKVWTETKRVARLLHENGFVHGDIRDSNILIDTNSLDADNVKLHFIDFDWAGRVERVKYPMGVNTTSVKRPATVKYDALITKEHDIAMVENLFEVASGPLPSLHAGLDLNKIGDGF